MHAWKYMNSIVHDSKWNDSQQLTSGPRLISRTHTWNQWLPSSWRGHSLEQLVSRERPSILFLVDMAVPFCTSCFTTEMYGVCRPFTPSADPSRPSLCGTEFVRTPDWYPKKDWELVFFLCFSMNTFWEHTWSLLVMLVTNVFHLSHMHNL